MMRWTRNLDLRERIKVGGRKGGWLICIQWVALFIDLLTCLTAVQSLVKDPDWPSGRAAVDFYFIQDDGGMFKCTFQYEPYFYIACKVKLFKSLLAAK
jgi:DNA polymerase epsilon subunit 1